MDAAKGLASSQRVGYSRAIQEHLGDRLRAYYERAQDRSVIDCRLAELIEQLSKSLEEKITAGVSRTRPGSSSNRLSVRRRHTH